MSVPVGAPAAPVSTAYSGAVVPIPDHSATGASATVSVTGTSLIQDLTLTIGGTSCSTAAGAGIDHSYVNDLTLTLTSPQGTVVTLMSRTGGSGDNLCQTVFSDSAAASIQDQGAPAAPFTGSFRPATPLSAFDQESPQGTWTLKAVDAAGTDTGSIRAFSIQIAGTDCTIANTAPAGVGDEYPAVQDQTRTVAAPGVLANDTDADGDDLTAELVSGPAHGTVTLNADGSFAYLPAAGYHGPDSFTYRPDDGTADGSTATVVAAGERHSYGRGRLVRDRPGPDPGRAGRRRARQRHRSGGRPADRRARGRPGPRHVDAPAPTGRSPTPRPAASPGPTASPTPPPTGARRAAPPPCRSPSPRPPPRRPRRTSPRSTTTSSAGPATPAALRTGRAGSIVVSETRTSFVRKMSRSHEYSVKIVTRAFHDVLGRNPDPSGREFWANRVQKGMPVATLALNLIASNEYLTKTGGTVDGFVNSTFNAILARQPSAAERSARVNQINGGRSRLAVASELYASTESRQRRTTDAVPAAAGPDAHQR